MPAFTNWLMVFLRASALLSVFPIFSMATVPVRLRLALGAAIAALVGSALPPMPLASDLWGLAGQMASEVAVGLVFGFAARMIFFALEIAGGIIQVEMGLTLPALMDPVMNGNSTATGMMLYLLAAMLWLSLDLHHWLLIGFQKTYELLPMGTAHMSPMLMGDIVTRSTQTFAIALQLAAPIMAVSFLISLAMAALGRAAPTMNVFAQSMALRPLAGLTIFGLCMQLSSQHITNYLRHLPEDVLRVAQILRAG